MVICFVLLSPLYWVWGSPRISPSIVFKSLSKPSILLSLKISKILILSKNTDIWLFIGLRASACFDSDSAYFYLQFRHRHQWLSICHNVICLFVLCLEKLCVFILYSSLCNMLGMIDTYASIWEGMSTFWLIGYLKT